MSAGPSLGSDPLHEGAKLIWPNLPLIAAIGVLMCVSFVPAMWLGAGMTPLGAMFGALSVGPAWAAAVAVADRVVLGHETHVRDLAVALRQYRGLGVRVATPSAICITSLLVTLAMWQQMHAPWLLGPLAAGVSGATLALLATVPAYPIAIRTGMRGRQLWITALRLVAASPLLAAGVLGGAGLAVYCLGISVSAALLLLIPGPLAIAVSACTQYARVPLPHH